MSAPFPPGKGPFKTKGNVYRALLESADARVPGGRQAVLARIEDPELAAFFAQPFLAASSYDVLPIVPFGMIGARIAGQPYPEFVRGGAAFTAKRDMNGIYRVLLKLASPDRVVVRLPRILVQYFDFGSIEGRFASPRVYEATIRDLPRPLLVWILNIAHWFVPVVMESAGARNVELVVQPPVAEEPRHGIEMVTARFEVRWS